MFFAAASQTPFTMNLIIEFVKEDISRLIPYNSRVSKFDVMNALWISGKKTVWRLLYYMRFNNVIRDSSGEIVFL